MSSRLGLVTAATCLLLGIWHFDTCAVPLTLISEGAIAWIAATAYRDLRAAHAKAAHFMQSLPVAAVAKVRVDWLTVVALALPFAAVVPLMLVAHRILTWCSASS